MRNCAWIYKIHIDKYKNNDIIIDMFLRNKLFIVFIIILLTDCQTGNNGTEYCFNKLVNIKTSQLYYSINLNGIENIKNKYYIKLYNMNKSINEYLLEKSYSLKITNWYFQPFYFQMTEGDMAIALLLDINIVADNDFYKMIPSEIEHEYIENGKNADIWWVYLHKDISNRENIIRIIRENITMNY
jgi:hypothetical protein